MSTVTAIIVTFNRLKNLQKALDATLQQDFAKIIVVDNASNDGTSDWLQKQYDNRLKVITLSENKGGAGGFATGMAAALQEECSDWLLLFDDDAYPAPDTLQNFQKQLLHDIDAVASAVYYPNGTICEMNRPSWNPFAHPSIFWRTLQGFMTGNTRASFHILDDDYAQSQPVRVDCASFVGFFVRATWARQHALPEAQLFIYGDDLLYTLRLTCAGGRLFFVPTVHFFHDCSTFARRGAYSPLWKAYFTYRNGLFVYRQAAGWWFYPVAGLKIFSWLTAVRFYPQKRRFLHLWWWAVKDGLCGDTSRNPQQIRTLFSDNPQKY